MSFPSHLEGPCHTIQHWISPTVSAVIMHMSCVHLHMYIIRAIFLECNWGLPLVIQHIRKSSTIQK